MAEQRVASAALVRQNMMNAQTVTNFIHTQRADE